MPDDDSNSSIVYFLGGAFAGLGFAAWLASQRRLSRAEREHPEYTIEVAEQVDSLLSELELDGAYNSEADFHDALIGYFEDETEIEIESKPRTDVGEPDIVLGDVVALEIKVNPRKGERDRCVGQVSAFAKEWLTMIVLFDTPPTRARALRRSLDAANSEHMPIIDFVADD